MFRREDLAMAGCIVTVGHDGAMQVIQGLVTCVETGQAVMSPAGYGPRGTSSPASQASRASGGRMTGMRPCTGATVSLAAVVRIVQVSTVSPGLRSAIDPVSAAPSGTVHRSHKPAKTRGSPLWRPNNQGWRVPPWRCHS